MEGLNGLLSKARLAAEVTPGSPGSFSIFGKVYSKNSLRPGFAVRKAFPSASA